MRRIILLLTVVLCSLMNANQLEAQDTTWVQTFTFDSISTRRANFEFPNSLNDKRFEKVLMYYKLKCSPQTPWDQYNCGEWDYLTYTRVFDHTGDYDSVRVDSVQYLHNYNSNAPYEYEPWGYDYHNSSLLTEHERQALINPVQFTLEQTASSTSFYPFDMTYQGGKYQMIVTATELEVAGINAGDLKSLWLNVSNLTNGGELIHPRILIKSTQDSELLHFHTSGFSTVYDLSRTSTPSPSGWGELQIGQNEFVFNEPFVWNGTDNIVIEIGFDHSYPALNQIEFETEISNNGQALNYSSKNGSLKFDGTNHALLEMSDVDLGDELTISMWVKGNGNTGVNTSILEGYDTLNQRVINIHMPWSNNRIYWDCGQGSAYDRIDKDMTNDGIDNEWHHWSFVKKQNTGEMMIYKDGSLWHSGTDKNRIIGNLHRLVLGANRSLGNHWKGNIDHFEVYNVALDEATISAWQFKKVNNSHPNWNNLMVAYDFDNLPYARDASSNNYSLMPSALGMFDFSEGPIEGLERSVNRLIVSFGNGDYQEANSTALVVNKKSLIEPEVLFEFEPVHRHFEISNASIVAPSGDEYVYDLQGDVVSSTPYSTSESVENTTITYYQEPYEVIFDVEIARYITPYGIGFDLGPNGFAWIYDVTDYQDYLRNVVDLAAHNTQELLDLSFAFIEGIPPRDVHKREPIWSDFKAYGFTAMAEDNVLQEKKVYLSDTSEGFKIKTRMSGHGQVGNQACCEWVSNDHSIKVDGVTRFEWDIFEEEDCGNNPLIGQGGTWPYAREGWCPGDKVKEYEFELTPYVTPGDSVALDYVINDVPSLDPGQGGGNYRAAYDLISYSAPNFENDAAIVDVLNPSNYEYYSKFNPTCSNPRVILRNTGSETLTSCTIKCWITYGDFIDYEWTGNLGFMEEEIVEIPVSNYSWWTDLDENQTFTAYVRDLNGSFGNDEYQQNSVKKSKFDASESVDGPFLIWFTTNNKASENAYRLMDAAGTVLFERTNLQNTTQYKDTFDLAPGCYSIVLDDYDDDGLSFWYSSQVEGETAGAFRVRKVGGSYMEIFPGDFGSYHRYDFSVGFTLGMDELPDYGELSIFPNPAQNELTIDLSAKVGGKARVEILDLSGRILLQDDMNASASFAEYFADVSQYKKGTYVIRISTVNGIYTKKFIKN